jgi:hypothetical protein
MVGTRLSADIQRHPPFVQPITNPRGVRCNQDGAPMRSFALAQAASSYVQTFRRDVCRCAAGWKCCMRVCMYGYACKSDASLQHPRRGAPASTPEGSRCYKGEYKVASRQTQLHSSHMVFRLCPGRHRCSVLGARWLVECLASCNDS